MVPKLSSDSQRGYIGLVVVVFMIVFAMLAYPNFFPSKGGSAGSCTAGTAVTEEVIETWPTMDGGDTGLLVEEQPQTQFKMIRKNVPITGPESVSAFDAAAWGSTGTGTHIYGKKYLNENRFLVYPKEKFGEHTIEPINGKPQRGIWLWGEGLVFVIHFDGPSTPTVVATRPAPEGNGMEGTPEEIRMVDVYQQVDKAKRVVEGTAGYTYDELFQCDGGGPLNEQGQSTETAPVASGNRGAAVVVPNQDVSEGRDQLQLEWILFDGALGVWGSHCKPAVYLYPESKQLVNVRVYPRGELTYTDPVYDPIKGWTVNSYPNGKLDLAFSSQSSAIRQYDYLYYETKLRDDEIKKPQEGWVVKGSSVKGQGSGELHQASSIKHQEKMKNMEELFDEILPKLGLNEREKKDFENYWLSKLPESPYYFVGLVDKAQRDYLEALVVTPAPETSIRFSLFFEMLDQPKVVQEPQITTPVRNGFTLVDWGGMIKLHPGTEFTCSQ